MLVRFILIDQQRIKNIRFLQTAISLNQHNVYFQPFNTKQLNIFGWVAICQRAICQMVVSTDRTKNS